MYEHSYNPYRNNISIVKDYFKKPAVLILAIMHFLTIVFSVISAIVTKDTVQSIARQISDYIDKHLVLHNSGDKDVGNVIMKALRDVLAKSDISIIPSINLFAIVTIIGLLLLYFGSRKSDPDSAPTAGVTILNILAIITLIGAIIVFVCLMVLAVALFIIYGVFSSDASRAFSVPIAGTRVRIDATLLLIIAIFYTVIAAIWGFLVLFYAIARKRFIGGIKSSLTSVELSNKGAKAFGVFSVLISISSGLSLLSGISSLVLSGVIQNTINDGLSKLEISVHVDLLPLAILSVLSQAAAFAVAILQAKISLGYSTYIEEKKYGYGAEGAPAAYIPPENSVQQTPYSYLAQPKTEEPAIKDDSFVKPFLDQDDDARTMPADNNAEPVFDGFKSADDDAPAEAEEKAPGVCPNCGNPVDGNSPFCGNCGTKL